MADESAFRVYLYGLDREYKMVFYSYLPFGQISANRIAGTARQLKSDFPSIEFVYAVDNSYTIHRAYKDLYLNDSIENRVTFKMMLEQFGFLVGVPGSD